MKAELEVVGSFNEPRCSSHTACCAAPFGFMSRVAAACSSFTWPILSIAVTVVCSAVLLCNMATPGIEAMLSPCMSTIREMD